MLPMTIIWQNLLTSALRMRSAALVLLSMADQSGAFNVAGSVPNEIERTRETAETKRRKTLILR
jgi:hypothetical protein